MSSAERYGVDPLMIAATMGLDSSMGTKGKGARNNNPGNVGQFDSLDAKGITVKGYDTLQDGIDAVANNLAKRQKALGLTQTQEKQLPTSMADIIPSPKQTAEQAKSMAYASRMNYAVNNLLQLEDKFAKLSYAEQEFQTHAPNVFKSEDQQIMDSAKQNFITAVLRQESGASISPTEFSKEERKYFPQPGDTIETVKQKQKARELAIKEMFSQAGKDENGKQI